LWRGGGGGGGGGLVHNRLCLVDRLLLIHWLSRIHRLLRCRTVYRLAVLIVSHELGSALHRRAVHAAEFLRRHVLRRLGRELGCQIEVRAKRVVQPRRVVTTRSEHEDRWYEADLQKSVHCLLRFPRRAVRRTVRERAGGVPKGPNANLL